MRLRRMAGRMVPGAVILTFLVLGDVALAASATSTVTYGYDASGRLISVSYDTKSIMTYTYDASGNRTQQVVTVPSK